MGTKCVEKASLKIGFSFSSHKRGTTRAKGGKKKKCKTQGNKTTNQSQQQNHTSKNPKEAGLLVPDHPADYGDASVDHWSLHGDVGLLIPESPPVQGGPPSSFTC